jgi:hypothetical protein
VRSALVDQVVSRRQIEPSVRGQFGSISSQVGADGVSDTLYVCAHLRPVGADRGDVLLNNGSDRRGIDLNIGGRSLSTELHERPTPASMTATAVPAIHFSQVCSARNSVWTLFDSADGRLESGKAMSASSAMFPFDP